LKKEINYLKKKTSPGEKEKKIVNEEKKKPKVEKIPIGVDAYNILTITSNQITNPGLSLSFAIIIGCLEKIAARALEINDEKIIELCKQISIIKDN
jgi:hypothetical protein